ncbi:MAG: iron-sulfur cluster carrier protein ApbC [Chloroflexota bacterium]
MPDITQDQIREALTGIEDPHLGKSLLDMRMIKDASVDGSTVDVQLELSVHNHPLAESFEQQIAEALKTIDGVEAVNVDTSVQVRPVGAQPGKEGVPGVKNAIAVASGKGGVGKSTIAVNLAVALAHDGAKVGLLDADVYGPSVPIMLGTNARPGMHDEKIIPLEAFGIKLMSIGFLLPSDKALIWRGPLVAQLTNQFLGDVDWGDLDYLVVDMPPGTGDAHLTLVQKIQIAGAIITTTPQDVAVADAVKGIKMFEEVKAPVLGIVENMSYFICPDCGSEYDIFGTGGGERTAKQFDVPLLGKIPIDPKVRQSGDIGHPVVASDPDSTVSQAFREAAREAALTLAQKAIERPHRPTIMLQQQPG